MKSNMFRYTSAILLCLPMLYATGCASIVKGRTQQVTFKSIPEGAKVTIDGRDIGSTPLSVLLDRKSKQVVTFQKEGYQPESAPMTTSINGWFWGNIALGGLVGSTTDGVTGAFHEYSPSFYNITLVPITDSNAGATQQREAKTFIIANYKHIIEELNTDTGQYIKSLWTLLKVIPDRQADALIKLKELAAEDKDIVNFADKAVFQLSTNNAR